jgi:hypothetical protein
LRKVHLWIGAETLEIRAIEITGSRIGDAPMLPDLLVQIPADQPGHRRRRRGRRQPGLSRHYRRAWGGGPHSAPQKRQGPGAFGALS